MTPGPLRTAELDQLGLTRRRFEAVGEEADRFVVAAVGLANHRSGFTPRTRQPSPVSVIVNSSPEPSGLGRMMIRSVCSTT